MIQIATAVMMIFDAISMLLMHIRENKPLSGACNACLLRIIAVYMHLCVSVCMCMCVWGGGDVYVCVCVCVRVCVCVCVCVGPLGFL